MFRTDNTATQSHTKEKKYEKADGVYELHFFFHHKTPVVSAAQLSPLAQQSGGGHADFTYTTILL